MGIGEIICMSKDSQTMIVAGLGGILELNPNICIQKLPVRNTP